MLRERVILLDKTNPTDAISVNASTAQILMPQLVPIDLSRGHKHEHPDIRQKQNYLYNIHGRWFIGLAYRQWYGWCFSGWQGASIQFDAPSSRGSGWRYLYELHDTGMNSSTTEPYVP